MHPVLFRLGPIGVYSYGFLIALGGFAACRFWRPRRERMGLPSEDAFWLLVNLMIISGFIGGRVLYVFEYTRPWSGEFWSSLFSFSRGFSVMGAFVSVLAALWWQARRVKTPFLKLLDYIVAATPLWHAFGRFGCFMAGCCFGRMTDVPWAVTFSDPRSLVDRPFLGYPLHPTQLYEALGDLVIAYTLINFVLPRVESGRAPTGTVVSVYFASYGILRFVVEFFRGDTVPFYFGLTAAQAFSAAMIVGASLLFLYNRRCASLCTQS